MSDLILYARRIYEAVQAQASAKIVGESVGEMLKLVAEGRDEEVVDRNEIQFHPLGFLACRWPVGDGQNLRIHLWSKDFGWAQEPGWEIHDHVFSFESIVLLGQIKNYVYDIAPCFNSCDPYSLYVVNYERKKSILRRVEIDVDLLLTESTIESAGSRYRLKSGVLHRSELLSNHAISVLATTEKHVGHCSPRVVSRERCNEKSFDRRPNSIFDWKTTLRYFSEIVASYH